MVNDRPNTRPHVRYIRISDSVLRSIPDDYIVPDCYGQHSSFRLSGDINFQTCLLCPIAKPCADGREIEYKEVRR